MARLVEKEGEEREKRVGRGTAKNEARYSFISFDGASFFGSPLRVKSYLSVVREPGVSYVGKNPLKRVVPKVS